MEAIQEKNLEINVVKVTGSKGCSRCSELSDIVWHAANVSGGLYEGFFSIPVDDWEFFIKNALGSDSSYSENVQIKIDRIFLKT